MLEQTQSGAKGRVLLLSTSMGIGGGAEEQVMVLALSLARRGWKTAIVSMIPPETEIPASIEQNGIPVHHLGMKAGRPDPRALLRLLRILRDFKPDLLHTHMTHANLLGRVARLFHKVPVLISTLHGHRMYGVNTRFTAFRELGHRWTDRMADITTAICEAAAESYITSRSAPAHKMLALPNGLDTNQYCPHPEVRRRMRASLGLQGFTWLAAGRLESPKNYPLMLRAFANSPNSGSLLICGGGALEPDLRLLACELGLSGRVRFLGVRRDMPDVMNACDAFVLSSDTEGLPMVLLQAAATALPVVATNVGGNAEVIEDGVSGYLTPPGELQPLAEALTKVATSLSREQRLMLGLAGRVCAATRYDLRTVADRWEQLYSTLLASSNQDPERKLKAYANDHHQQTCYRP